MDDPSPIRAVLTFIGYLLPACLVVGGFLVVVIISARQVSRNQNYLAENNALQREIRDLFRELVRAEQERNELLRAHRDRDQAG